MPNRPLIAIAQLSAFQEYESLFLALAELFQVRFVPYTEEDISAYCGVILLNVDRQTALTRARNGRLCFVVLASESGAAMTFDGGELRFEGAETLAPCLRGRNFECRQRVAFTPLQLRSGDLPLATLNGHVFWAQYKTDAAAVDFVSLPLPKLSIGEYLCEYFHPPRFVELLPLLSFLKRVCSQEWEAPPLRACLIFDDPNLHRASYGFLKLEALSRHATEHHYHAAIATVPLDGWWVSSSAKRVFQDNASAVSLLVHGNNHTRLELHHQDHAHDWRPLLAQALRRKTDMEKRHGLQIARVMEPPHGAFDYSLTQPLAQLGYEAVMVVSQQCVRWDRNGGWPVALGMDVTDAFPFGLTGIPRIVLSADWKVSVLLAAFLRQPIVIAGHHWDAADGLRLVKEIADFVNALGPVRWCNVEEIARTSYKMRVDLPQMRIQMRGRRLLLNIPSGVEFVIVERYWLDAGECELLMVEDEQGRRLFTGSAGAASSPIAIGGAESLTISSPLASRLDYAAIRPPPKRLWPIARRLLSEGRDRLQPLMPSRPTRP